MRFRIITFDEIDSTQTYALSLAKEGIAEGTVVISDYQTKGRGRFRRRWQSQRGENLLFSIIFGVDIMKTDDFLGEWFAKFYRKWFTDDSEEPEDDSYLQEIISMVKCHKL